MSQGRQTNALTYLFVDIEGVYDKVNMGRITEGEKTAQEL